MMINSKFNLVTTSDIVTPDGATVLVREGAKIGTLEIQIKEKTQPIITAQHKQTKELLEVDLINFREGLLLSEWQWFSLSDVELTLTN